MSSYEQCVLDAEGQCTRWSHGHETSPVPNESPLSEERIREVVREELYTVLAVADIRAGRRARSAITVLIETLSQIIIQRREGKYPARGGLVLHDEDNRRVYIIENRE